MAKGEMVPNRVHVASGWSAMVMEPVLYALSQVLFPMLAVLLSILYVKMISQDVFVMKMHLWHVTQKLIQYAEDLKQQHHTMAAIVVPVYQHTLYSTNSQIFNY